MLYASDHEFNRNGEFEFLARQKRPRTAFFEPPSSFASFPSQKAALSSSTITLTLDRLDSSVVCVRDVFGRVWNAISGVISIRKHGINVHRHFRQPGPRQCDTQASRCQVHTTNNKHSHCEPGFLPYQILSILASTYIDRVCTCSCIHFDSMSENDGMSQGFLSIGDNEC